MRGLRGMSSFARSEVAMEEVTRGDARFRKVYDATGGASAQDVLESFNSQGPREAALTQQKMEMEAEIKARREALRVAEQAMRALTLGGVETDVHRETDAVNTRLAREERRVSAAGERLVEGRAGGG